MFKCTNHYPFRKYLNQTMLLNMKVFDLTNLRSASIFSDSETAVSVTPGLVQSTRVVPLH